MSLTVEIWKLKNFFTINNSSELFDVLYHMIKFTEMAKFKLIYIYSFYKE